MYFTKELYTWKRSVSYIVPGKPSLNITISLIFLTLFTRGIMNFYDAGFEIVSTIEALAELESHRFFVGYALALDQRYRQVIIQILCELGL